MNCISTVSAHSTSALSSPYSTTSALPSSHSTTSASPSPHSTTSALPSPHSTTSALPSPHSQYNLSTSTKTYLQPCQTSKMELQMRKYLMVSAVIYFCKYFIKMWEKWFKRIKIYLPSSSPFGKKYGGL